MNVNATLSEAEAREYFEKYPRPLEFVSWNDVHEMSLKLAKRLQIIGNFSAVVGVSKGGWMPAMIVARELGIRHVGSVCASSYSISGEQCELTMVDPISQAILELGVSGGDPVLVVDDLVDTGNTAIFIKKLLPRCHYAVLHAKPQGRKFADTYIQETPQEVWILYPWDNKMVFVPRKPLVETGRK